MTWISDAIAKRKSAISSSTAWYQEVTIKGYRFHIDVTTASVTTVVHVYSSMSSHMNADPDTSVPLHLDSEADLDSLIADHDVVLVEFFTDGCGICASMEPVLGNVAKATDAIVGLVNPRNDPPLIDRFSVQSVPLFVLFRDGVPVARRADGFVAGEDLVSWIERHAN